MCFSPEMDIAAAAVIGVVAIDTLRRVRRPAEVMLAALPAVFALHQLVEAFVWWGLEGQVSTTVGDVATRLYLAIAWLLPVYVPIAIRAVEPSTRRRLDAAFVLVGAAVTAVLAWATLHGPIVATIEDHHLSYDVDVPLPTAVVALYVLVTCAPMLISQHLHIRLYGLVNLPVVAALAWLSQSGPISLWCVWAAVTSIAINLHLRYNAPPPPRAGPARAGLHLVRARRDSNP